jgi:hypothetical protein
MLVHELKPHDEKCMQDFWWFRDLIIANGEDILDIMFFSDEAWFIYLGM